MKTRHANSHCSKLIKSLFKSDIPWSSGGPNNWHEHMMPKDWGYKVAGKLPLGKANQRYALATLCSDLRALCLDSWNFLCMNGLQIFLHGIHYRLHCFCSQDSVAGTAASCEVEQFLAPSEVDQPSLGVGKGHVLTTSIPPPGMLQRPPSPKCKSMMQLRT